MRLGRSWDVPDEFWMLRWRSRQLRTIIIQADVEPAGKGHAGKRSAPEFQRQVLDQMERYRQYPMTGPVARGFAGESPIVTSRASRLVVVVKS